MDMPAKNVVVPHLPKATSPFAMPCAGSRYDESVYSPYDLSQFKIHYPKSFLCCIQIL